jgi:hypothetical protein
LNKLSALEPAEPVRRYERENPGELIHIDIKKLGRSGLRATNGPERLRLVDTNPVISKSFTAKKAMRVDFAKQFTKDCHQLGIVIHGTSFWPSWRDQAIGETIRCATGCSILPRTSISVSTSGRRRSLRKWYEVH